jgi:cytochrome c-type biogenesis protein CcmH
MKRFLLIIALLLYCTQALAARPDEMLTDPALEARARTISKELRCPVCQNQSIDDSDADLAHDLRVLVRQRLKAGDSDEQVKQYIVNRYGDYVLLDPPFKSATYVLWLGPAVILLLAFLVAGGAFKPKPDAEEDPEIDFLEKEKKRTAKEIEEEQEQEEDK